MKFLIVARPGAVQPPPDQVLPLYQAAKEWMNERLESGKTECHYTFPQGGGIAISNADSHEELADEIQTYPLFSFYEFKVEALCDWRHIFDRVIKSLQESAS